MFRPVASSILSLCIMMSFGFFFSKKKLFDDKVITGISYILLNLSMPCMVITAMQLDYTNELFKDAIFCMVLFFILTAVSSVIGIIISKLLRKDAEKERVFAFAITFPNIMYVGYPVIGYALGEKGLFYAGMCSAVFNLLCFSYGIWILAGKNANFKLKQILNPACVTSIIGFILFISRIKLGGAALMVVDGFGKTTVPLSMLSVGAMLAGTDFKSMFSDKNIYLLSAVRLLVFPILCHIVLRVLINDNTLVSSLTLLLGMPVATVTAILARNYKADAVFASKTVFATTVLAVATLPVLAAFIS